MPTNRRTTIPSRPNPHVPLKGLCLYGVGAGILGVAAYVQPCRDDIELILTQW